MHYAICTAHRFAQAARIEKIALDKGEISMLGCRCDKFRHASAEVVITDNCFAIIQQPVDQITTDEPGRPCHKGSQDTIVPCSEHKSCGLSIVVEHFDSFEGVVAEIFADES